MNSYISYCFLLVFILFSCNQEQKEASKDKQIIPEPNMKIEIQQGIVTKISAKNFDETYSSLIEIISSNPDLKVIAELNHQSNAASVDLELRPTRIIMFGNPKLGTPLMQSSQTTGLDLPQKILIWQDNDDAINISYNDPLYLKQRHGIVENDKILKKISGALHKITNAAAGL